MAAIVEDAARKGAEEGAATPGVSSVSSDALKVAIDERCTSCRQPGGSIGELWTEFKPIRKYVYMVMGAVAVLAVVVGITVPRINSKLDTLEEMAKDMAAMKVQVNWILIRGGQGAQLDRPAPSYATLPPGVTP
jgi:hypothetical protein